MTEEGLGVASREDARPQPGTTVSHTPGPWDGSHIGKDSLAQLHIYGPDGLHIYHRDRPQAVQEANARLCAAAPDLLKACSDWIEWLRPDAPWRDDAYDHEMAMLDAIRAAIAKAEGRS